MCQQDTGDVFEHEKGIGLGKLIDATEASGFFELHGCLLSFPLVVYVHNECRKYFTDQRKIKRHKSEDAAALLRGLHSKGILYWKHVFEHASRLMLIYIVHKLEIRESLRCAVRADEWGLQVSGWLQWRNDLVAEEALYHHNLYLCFTQHRNMVPESSKVDV